MVDVDSFMDKTLSLVPIGMSIAVAGYAFKLIPKGAMAFGKFGKDKIKWL